MYTFLTLYQRSVKNYDVKQIYEAMQKENAE